MRDQTHRVVINHAINIFVGETAAIPTGTVIHLLLNIYSRLFSVYPFKASYDYNRFYSVLSAVQSQLLTIKLVLKHQDLQMFGLKLNKYE